jgi:hypothetical protein
MVNGASILIMVLPAFPRDRFRTNPEGPPPNALNAATERKDLIAAQISKLCREKPLRPQQQPGSNWAGVRVENE